MKKLVDPSSARRAARRSALLLPLALLAGVSPAGADVRFILTDLGTLGGVDSQSRSINAAGDVVGGSTPAGAEFMHPFLWQPSTGMRDLAPATIFPDTAFGINGAGQVVGQSDFRAGASVYTHGFAWQAGRLRDLSGPSVKFSAAYGVNTAGQIVGQAWTPAILTRATLWQNGQEQDLGTIDLSGVPLAAGLRWDTSKLYASGEIGIAAVPEPQTWALLLAGLGLIGRAARRAIRPRHR